jgi:hypothetical protein
LAGSEFVTASRQADLVLLILLAGAMLFLAPRLRVYYFVTVVDVTMERILPDGRRESLPTPVTFEHIGQGYTSLSQVVPQVEGRVDLFMATLPPESAGPAGTRYEWTVRYARNSMTLDRSALIVREVSLDGE